MIKILRCLLKKQGTQFRIWANQVLKDHTIKGYTINPKRCNDKVDYEFYLWIIALALKPEKRFAA